uniref:Transcriptional regulator, LysR family n=1 Tax=Caulobacter sp. (strain K31) TaxID=366602 RepID=B0SVN6_CAUSK
MHTPRRFYPPTSLLRAFEAAARSQSFTIAARELSLTQSAVSRQIRALEAMLGADLFHREKQKVRLTLAGATYARDIREALTRISSATLGFRANPVGGSLNLAVLPLFAARWLAPRLPAFAVAHPDITVNLMTRPTPFDFRADSVDAAIHYGLAEWPGAEVSRLMAEIVAPVCTPLLKAKLGLRTAADLIEAPLLHLTSRSDAWERWFGEMEIDAGEVRGMLLDQFTLSLEVARNGLGIALLPVFLIEPELARGELVAAVDAPMHNAEAYHFVWPHTHQTHWPLEIFRRWITAEAADAE